jgi:triosephosphate isomerase
MYGAFRIAPPFFEIGPKAYLYGEGALMLAREADRLSVKYGVQIIYTPQYVDIPAIARETKHIMVFAQHMDPVEIGRGIGAVLAEALKSAGARGVLLNHAEKKMALGDIAKAIRRADEVGLASMVCADNLMEAMAVAQLEPNIIIAEPEALIGQQPGNVGNRTYVKEINEKVRAIDPRIQVLHSAGIKTGQDVYDIIQLGAEATGCTSGIVRAENPVAAMEEMLKALRESWDERRAAHRS